MAGKQVGRLLGNVAMIRDEPNSSGENKQMTAWGSWINSMGLHAGQILRPPTGGVMASTWRSSFVNHGSNPAWTFSATCSGERAPGTTVVTAEMPGGISQRRVVKKRSAVAVQFTES